MRGWGGAPSRAPAAVQNELRASRIMCWGGSICGQDQLNPGAAGVGLPCPERAWWDEPRWLPWSARHVLAHGERMRRGRGGHTAPDPSAGRSGEAAAPAGVWPSLQGMGKRSPTRCLLGFPSRVCCWVWSLPGTVGTWVSDPWCMVTSEASGSCFSLQRSRVCPESRAAPWPYPRAGPCLESDVLEGRSPSPVPVCSLDHCSPSLLQRTFSTG